MGGGNSKKQKSDEFVEEKEVESVDDREMRRLNETELKEYRLYCFEYEKDLMKGINLYWNEVHIIFEEEIIKQINIDNDPKLKLQQQKMENKNNDNNSDWMDGLSNNEAIIVSGKNNKKRKDLSYFTKDVYNGWTFIKYIEIIFRRESEWKHIYYRSIYHLKILFNKNINTNTEQNSDILSENEFLDFLWIYIGYLYWKCKSTEYSLGNSNLIYNFLNTLSLLFKAIMIGYDYEMFKYKKICNHWMKPCLSNINKDLLSRAQTINNSILKNDKHNVYESHKKIYNKIIFRMDACKYNLSQNGIQIKKNYKNILYYFKIIKTRFL